MADKKKGWLVPEEVLNEIIITLRADTTGLTKATHEWNKAIGKATISGKKFSATIPTGVATASGWSYAPSSGAPRKPTTKDVTLGSGWHNPMCEPTTIVSQFDSPDAFLTVVWPTKMEAYAVVYGAKDLHTADPPHVMHHPV